jgi:hypothetical protein
MTISHLNAGNGDMLVYFYRIGPAKKGKGSELRLYAKGTANPLLPVFVQAHETARHRVEATQK